jgi:8-oxo-dGTP pyrophosphatase MutT (NUDIX family)
MALDKVAAVLLLRRDGAALLQHRDDKPGLRHANMWGPPGGHADPGESMNDCARRELQEEAGYEAADIQFVLSFDDAVEGFPVYQLNVFWCWYDGVQSITCHEGQELAFIERSAAAHYAIPLPIMRAWDAALAAAGITIEKTYS